MIEGTFRTDEHSLDVLDFTRVKSDIEDLALSDEGRVAIQKDTIKTDHADLETLHIKVDYLMRLFDFDLVRPRYGFPGIRPALDALGTPGSSLDSHWMIGIADYLRAARDLARWMSLRPDERLESPIRDDLAAVDDLPDLERTIRSVVDENGEVRDDLPSLTAIVRRTREARASLHQMARAHLLDRRDLWQTDVPTIKDDRTVLPLKSDHRGRVRGIVRDVSPTGATIFIEPDDIVEGNNTLSLLGHEYAAEVARILRELTGKVREYLPNLESLLQSVAALDSLYARARYGESHRSISPREKAKGIRLIAARHPLLGREAVPIDIELEEGVRCMIITGPNAGGKTVSLKTIGLFSCMHQFGIPLPAKESTGLAIFDGIFADIGDEQSIDESLSTFSGHVRNIARFLENATENSLVLLDELGSGTDPEQGAAMAMAVIDEILEIGSTIVVTTHHGVLKNYGFTRANAVNASVSFDSDAHVPTYRVTMGTPGESHALEIAESSGLSRGVIEQAIRYMDEESSDVASMIRSMSEKERELESVRAELADREMQINEKQRETDLLSLRLRQRDLELRTHGYAELKKQMHEYRSRLETLVREIKDGELDRAKTKKVKEYIEQIGESVEKERESIERTRYELRPVTDIEPGMEVVIGDSKQRGRVVRAAKKGNWVVETDKMRITLPEHQISGIVESEHLPKRVEIQKEASLGRPSLVLDLRGMRLEEAMSALQQQIDRCILSGTGSFEIVHGLGEGILKNGVQDFLAEQSSVSQFSFARPEQGGFGKTVVTLG